VFIRSFFVAIVAFIQPFRAKPKRFFAFSPPGEKNPRLLNLLAVSERLSYGGSETSENVPV